MKANLKKNKENMGKWSRWIGGGALVLALAGLLVPATTSAMIDIPEEVIVIEDEAPWTPPNWGGHSGGGGSNSTPSGDMNGGGGGGGGSIPSGGGSKPKPSPAEKRLFFEKGQCLVEDGVWGPAVFNDIDTNVAFAGYSCTIKISNSQYKWRYYDSEGYYNHRCVGDLEVQTCEE